MEPEQELGPEGVRILAALFATEPCESLASLPEGALSRFVLGWSGEAATDAVVDALVDDPALRERMIAMRAELKDGEVRDPELRGVLDAEVARALGGIREVPARHQWLGAAPREAMRVVDGILRSVGRRLTDPAGFGFATSRGDDWISVGDGDPLRAQVAVSVVGGDAVFDVRFDRPVDPGTRIWIDLWDPVVGSIPFGDGLVDGDRMALTVPGVGKAMDLEDGPLPAWSLRVRLRENSADSAEWRVEFADGSGEPIRVPVSAAPRVEAGSMTVEIDLPASMAPELERYDLAAWLVTDPRPVPLGRAPAAEVGRSGRLVLEVQAADGPVPYEALLLSLVAVG